jgi:hypothetical protein
VVAVIEAIKLAGRLVTSSEPLMRALSQGSWSAVEALLLHAALVTIAFAVIERTGWLKTYLEGWKPESLPDLATFRDISLKELSALGKGELRPSRAPRPPRRWEAVTGLAFGGAFLAWWLGALVVPIVPEDARVAVHAAPVWTALLWPIAALVMVRMIHDLVTLLRPQWRPLRGALIIGNVAGTIAIAALLYQAGQVVSVTGTDPGQVADLQESLDLALHWALVLVPLMTVLAGAVELWRLVRER